MAFSGSDSWETIENRWTSQFTVNGALHKKRNARKERREGRISQEWKFLEGQGIGSDEGEKGRK